MKGIQLVKSGGVLLVLSLVNVFYAAAEVLCYRTSAYKAGSHAEVQVFNRTCPKGFSAVSEAALLQTTELVAENFNGNVGPQGAQGAPGAVGPQGPRGDQGIRGIQGVTGLKGPPGIQGAVGAQGLEGDKGVMGSQGAKGEQGVPGLAGLPGDQGPQGDRGPQGSPAIGTNQLFRFSGSSGAALISPNAATLFGVLLQPNSVQKQISTDFQQMKTTAPLVGTSCSKIGYFAEVSASPGPSNAWIFRFVLAEPGSSMSDVDYLLCTISGSATRCSGTAEVAVLANLAGVVAFQGSSNSIPAVKAHWNIRCLAS